ncbi:MAG TPA: branched-chain amino acid ABC transporter permease [Streptosporangiaceae bacterium]|nr:branched-chain amino acid ABC transporter permease [Streptosporangiaceae bacterium]
MTYFLQALVSGLLQGGLLALTAVGFTLVWGVLNVVNLAHGATVVLGAYLTWELSTAVGLNPVLAAAVATAVLFGFGYTLQRWLLDPLARAPVLIPLLVTFGTGLLLSDAIVAVFSSDYRTLGTAYSRESVKAGGLYVPVLSLGSLVVALALTVGVALWLGRTRYGTAIRAVGMDRGAARLMGIRVRHVCAVAFGIGASLAAVAGSLAAVVTTFSPASAGTYTVESFIIAVIGGVGSTRGALAGGLLLGVLQEVGAVYLPGTYSPSLIAFVLLVLVLVFRPQGLVGRARLSERIDT